MERIDTRPPFAASGGVIPPELRKDQNTLLCSRRSGAYKKCRINGKYCQKNWLQNAAGTEGLSVIMTAIIFWNLI